MGRFLAIGVLWAGLTLIDAGLCWLTKRIVSVGGVLYALAMLVAEQIAKGLDRIEDKWYRIN